MAKTDIKSEITGKVWKVEAEVGARLAADDPILILESMKMEIPVPAPREGTVVEIRVERDDAISEGDVVAVMELG